MSTIHILILMPLMQLQDQDQNKVKEGLGMIALLQQRILIASGLRPGRTEVGVMETRTMARTGLRRRLFIKDSSISGKNEGSVSVNMYMEACTHGWVRDTRTNLEYTFFLVFLISFYFLGGLLAFPLTHDMI